MNIAKGTFSKANIRCGPLPDSLENDQLAFLVLVSYRKVLLATLCLSTFLVHYSPSSTVLCISNIFDVIFKKKSTQLCITNQQRCSPFLSYLPISPSKTKQQRKALFHTKANVSHHQIGADSGKGHFGSTFGVGRIIKLSESLGFYHSVHARTSFESTLTTLT